MEAFDGTPGQPLLVRSLVRKLVLHLEHGSSDEVTRVSFKRLLGKFSFPELSKLMRAENIALGNDYVRLRGHEKANMVGSRCVIADDVAQSEYFPGILSAMWTFDDFPPDLFGFREAGQYSVAGTSYRFSIAYYDREFSAKVDPMGVEPHRVLTLKKVHSKQPRAILLS